MNNKRVIISVTLLAIIVLGLGFINKESLGDKKEIHENAEIIIKGNGTQEKINLEEIKNIGEEEFSADLKSSGKAAEEHIYTGVLLKEIFEEVGIKLEEDKQVILTAIDGYVVALESNEVLEDGNVYLAYKMDGESLGTREEGGSGPYQVIIRNDQFSQRWCKHVVEIKFDE